MIWHPVTCTVSVVLYLGCVYGLRKYMDKAPAFELTAAMKVYNLAQVVLCGYMCYGLWSNPFSNFFRLNVPHSQTAEYFIYIHYLSKFLDFFDTVFMCLRRKFEQMTVLHLFHHASIPLIWSILLYCNAAFGTTSLGAFANSIVHCIMYTHYLFAACGIKNPFKSLVTRVQQLQFSILIGHSIVALCLEKLIPSWLCIVQFAYQITMLVMFQSFYTRAYSKLPAGKSDAKSPAAKSDAKSG